MDILSLLNWRHASKRMNGAKVPAEKVDTILESIRLSASSMGLQPYKVLVISNPELLEKIRPLANNQPQITEASHLLIFAAWSKVTEERVQAYISNMAAVRKVPESSFDVLKGYGLHYASQSAEQNFNWTSRQAYIALGTAMVAAASLEVDSTPMEGFNGAAVDELLGLEELGLRSVAFLTLGYRDTANDWLASLPKVRTPKHELFIEDGQLVY
ncbi:NAD(P)H-dependent oxidoreductase [Hufsiella ginkgonis]|uniref:NAD(P)H-dependent oxidoreductase n=1 Tax=Hufsiella ginkgonis TaxID=2695274 RepID=A0A7K1XUV3_9SPHI|nr:NAD(P)H-dependent oxidoreductase [Hufsiella ginkgonis]MXV14762.1 NAD(P)H-dependent oxidoreductase [Hufsiella ginkgonis]